MIFTHLATSLLTEYTHIHVISELLAISKLQEPPPKLS